MDYLVKIASSECHMHERKKRKKRKLLSYGNGSIKDNFLKITAKAVNTEF